MKKSLEKLAQRISANGGIVADQVCIDLWNLMNDAMEKELQRKIYTIWKSSRCSNGDLVQMTLEMLAATLPDEQALTPAEKRTRDVCAAAQVQITEERNQKGAPAPKRQYFAMHDAGLRNGSFYRTSTDGNGFAQYMNGDYMDTVSAVPAQFIPVDREHARKLVPKICRD